MYLFANYAGILYPYLLSRQEKLIPCLWRPTLHEEILIALWACAVYLSHRPIPLARERASARRRILRWSPLIRWPERSCHPQANRTLFHAAIDRGRAKPPESSRIDPKEGWAKRSARSRCCSVSDFSLQVLCPCLDGLWIKHLSLGNYCVHSVHNNHWLEPEETSQPWLRVLKIYSAGDLCL